MTKNLRFLGALGAILFALLGLSACGGGLSSDAVVQVGSYPITKTTFDHWMEVAAVSSATTGASSKPVIPVPPSYSACIAHLAATAAKPAKGQSAPTSKQLKTQCETQYKSLQQQVLSFLISADWIIGEAKALGVKLTDKEVQKELVTIKNQQFTTPGSFEKFLTSSGQTMSDLLLRVKVRTMLPQKIEQKVTSKKATVSEAEVEKYYNENKSRYGTPEKRGVEIVLTKTEAQASSAKKEVESGTSFAKVAKKDSIDPTSKADGGVLPEVVKGEEEAALDKAIFATAKGVLSGPIKTPFGYYIFEVLSTKAGTQQPLAKERATIKQQLIATKQQSALSTFIKNFKTKWTAKTDCRTGYVVQSCKQYKAPKGAAAASNAAE